MPTIVGIHRLEELLRRVAGFNVDRSDLERLSDAVNRKLIDLLVIGVRNASFNGRDIVREPDVPLTKGLLQTIQEFRAYRQGLEDGIRGELGPVLEQLSAYPQLDRDLGHDVRAMLPDIAGALIVSAARLARVMDREVENPGRELWERVFRAMDAMV